MRPKRAEQWLVIGVAEAEVQSRCRRAEPRQAWKLLLMASLQSLHQWRCKSLLKITSTIIRYGTWHTHPKHRSSFRFSSLSLSSEFSLLSFLVLFSSAACCLLFYFSSGGSAGPCTCHPSLCLSSLLSSTLFFNPPVAVEQLKTGTLPDAVWFVGLFFFSCTACWSGECVALFSCLSSVPLHTLSFFGSFKRVLSPLSPPLPRLFSFSHSS